MALTQKSLKAKMHSLVADGDRESYEKVWKSITWLWNLGLIDIRIYQAMLHEDQRMYDSGEMEPMLDKSPPDWVWMI